MAFKNHCCLTSAESRRQNVALALLPGLLRAGPTLGTSRGQWGREETINAGGRKR